MRKQERFCHDILSEMAVRVVHAKSEKRKNKRVWGLIYEVGGFWWWLLGRGVPKVKR